MPKKPPTETTAMTILLPSFTIKSSTLPTFSFWSLYTADPISLPARRPPCSFTEATARSGFVGAPVATVGAAGDDCCASADPAVATIIMLRIAKRIIGGSLHWMVAAVFAGGGRARFDEEAS